MIEGGRVGQCSTARPPDRSRLSLREVNPNPKTLIKFSFLKFINLNPRLTSDRLAQTGWRNNFQKWDRLRYQSDLIRYQKLSFSCSFLYFSLISNAHQAHIRSQKLQFSCSFLYISLICNAHQIPKTFIFMQFFVYFLDFQCSSGAHRLPKITIFMQFFIYFFDFRCSLGTQNFHFPAVFCIFA